VISEKLKMSHALPPRREEKEKSRPPPDLPEGRRRKKVKSEEGKMGSEEK